MYRIIKSLCCTPETNITLLKKDSAEDISGDINRILILYNKMCQHLENQHNLVNQFFLMFIFETERDKA